MFSLRDLRSVLCVPCSVHVITMYNVRKGSWAFLILYNVRKGSWAFLILITHKSTKSENVRQPLGIKKKIVCGTQTLLI